MVVYVQYCKLVMLWSVQQQQQQVHHQQGYNTINNIASCSEFEFVVLHLLSMLIASEVSGEQFENNLRHLRNLFVSGYFPILW